MYKVVIIKSSKSSFRRRHFCLLRKMINEGVGKQDDNFENKEQNYPALVLWYSAPLTLMAKQQRNRAAHSGVPADSTVLISPEGTDFLCTYQTHFQKDQRIVMFYEIPFRRRLPGLLALLLNGELGKGAEVFRPGWLPSGLPRALSAVRRFIFVGVLAYPLLI